MFRLGLLKPAEYDRSRNVRSRRAGASPVGLEATFAVPRERTFLRRLALDGDAEAFVVGDGDLEEGDGTSLSLVGLDLAKGDARSVVYADMDELPTVPDDCATPRGARP